MIRRTLIELTALSGLALLFVAGCAKTTAAKPLGDAGPADALVQKSRNDTSRAAARHRSQTNGMGPNGLGLNGMGPNGMGPNGMGPNGEGLNGMGPNGMGPKGLGMTGLGPYRQDLAGLTCQAASGGFVCSIAPGARSLFDAWFQRSKEADSYMEYFTRCAYDAKTEIHYPTAADPTHMWKGHYAFAMTSLKAGRQMTRDEGKWVSSCLVAHVNTRGTHEYISIRGNPPNAEAQEALKPTPGERWAMSYPEGMFFGDVLTPPSAAPAAYIASLNIPQATPSAIRSKKKAIHAQQTPILGAMAPKPFSGVPGAQTCPNDSWPPGVATGREEWFDKRCGRGTFQSCERSHRTATLHPEIALPDPDYRADAICGSFESPDACDKPIKECDVGAAPPYHPVFVQSAMLANLESATKTVDPERIIQALDRGSTPIDFLNQVKICSARQCIACFDPMAALVTAPGAGLSVRGKLVRLRDTQSLEVLLQVPSRLRQRTVPIEPDMNEAFTAIVRYTNVDPPKRDKVVRVKASDPSSPDGWKDFGTLRFPSTVHKSDQTDPPTFSWFQVYPVRPVEKGAERGPFLKIRISGGAQSAACSGPAAGAVVAQGVAPLATCTPDDAPELDAVGFISGPPSCVDDDENEYVGVCSTSGPEAAR